MVWHGITYTTCIYYPSTCNIKLRLSTFTFAHGRSGSAEIEEKVKICARFGEKWRYFQCVIWPPLYIVAAKLDDGVERGK